MRFIHRVPFVAGVLACGGLPSPSVDEIEPSRGLTDRETVVRILGRGFDVALDGVGEELQAVPWTGEVGHTALSALRWISSSEIQAIVPPGLAPGTHGLVLRSGAREVRVAEAFVAVRARAPRLDAAEPSVVPREGGPVVLRGIGLHLGTRVSVRGVAVPNTWRSDATVEIEVPPGEVGFVRIEVETPVGHAARTDLLSVADPP